MGCRLSRIWRMCLGIGWMLRKNGDGGGCTVLLMQGRESRLRMISFG